MSNINSLFKFKFGLKFRNKAKGNANINLKNAFEYGERKKIAVREFSEKYLLTLKNAIILEENNLPAFNSFHSYLDSILLDIRREDYRFSNNHLLDDELNVIYHIDLPFGNLPIAKQFLNKSPKKLKGTIAYLSNTAAIHYGHWLRLVFPLLRIYQKYLPLEQIDYFYIGDVEIPKFIAESLELAGIPKEKIINFPCKSERFLCAITQWKKQNEGNAYLDKGSYDFVRKLFVSKVDTSTNCCYASRVFISRGNVQWRKLLNEAEVIDLLKKYDFEFRTLDNLSILEQVQIFYHADVIVAPHGAALTNLFFIKENTKVLEIFPYNYSCPTSYTLAAYSQAEYYYMRGKEIAEDKTEPCYADILVDISQLEKFCEKYLT